MKQAEGKDVKHRALLIALVISFLSSAFPVFGIEVSPGGQGPTGSTMTQVTVATTNTLVTLTAASNYITIANSSGNTVFFSEVSPASSSSAPIYTSSAYTYEGVPLTQFWLIAPAGSSVVGVLAH